MFAEFARIAISYQSVAVGARAHASGRHGLLQEGHALRSAGLWFPTSLPAMHTLTNHQYIQRNIVNASRSAVTSTATAADADPEPAPAEEAEEFVL